jgi:LytS/YehU family sensor histidine kinase
VTDSGQPTAAAASPGAGVGLHNVQDRLVQRFGSQQHFTAGYEPAGGFKVSVEMPLEYIP